MLRILCLPRTAVVCILDRGLDTQLAANAKHTLVVDRQMMIDRQIVPQTPIALVRTFCMKLLQFLGDLFILDLPR